MATPNDSRFDSSVNNVFADDEQLDMASFKQTNINDDNSVSIHYQLITAYQDDFAEAFFPTEILKPQTNSYDISLERQELIDYATHPTDGSLLDMSRRSILELTDHHDLINEDGIRLLPHLANSDDSEVTRYFVEPEKIATQWVDYGNQQVAYRPLKPDITINLLSLAQRSQQVTGQPFDYTDAIEHLQLERIYIELSDGQDQQIVPFKVSELSRSAFLPSHEGPHPEASLHLRHDELFLTQDFTTIDGSALTLIPQITNDDDVLVFTLNVYGRAWLDTGDVVINPTVPRLVAFVDTQGQRRSVDGYSAKIIGYDLYAQRANSNWRELGALVDTNEYHEQYNLYSSYPVFTPIPPEMEQTNVLPTVLINAVRLRQRNAAVSALLNYAQALSQYTGAIEQGLELDITGIGRYLVKPFYRHMEINIAQFYDYEGNPKSTYTSPQVAWHIATYLRQLVGEMLDQSGYGRALQHSNNDEPVSPCVVIGCHKHDQQYLYISERLRLLGARANYRIVATSDERMRNKLLISFTQGYPGSRDALSFGVHAYVPENIERLVTPKNGEHTLHVGIRPRYRHIPTLPILAEVDLFTKEQRDPTVAQPENLQPTNGYTGVSSEGVVLEASDFSVKGGEGTLNAAEWRLYTNGGTSPIWSATNSDTSISVPGSELSGDATYEWQVRYQGNTWGWSDWSVRTSFVTEEPYVAQPENLQPADGESSIPEEDLTLVASDFEVNGGNDTFAQAEWEVYEQSTGNEVYSMTQDLSPQTEPIFSIRTPSVRQPEALTPRNDSQHVDFTNGLMFKNTPVEFFGEYDGAINTNVTIIEANTDELVWDSVDTGNVVTVENFVFEYGKRYYWQVRHEPTSEYDEDDLPVPSDWSEPAYFNTIERAGYYIYQAFDNGALIKRDPHTRKIVQKSTDLTQSIDRIALSADGWLYGLSVGELFSVNGDDLADYTSFGSIQGARAIIEDGRGYLLVGYENGAIERIDPQDQSAVNRYEGHVASISRLMGRMDGYLYSLGADFQLHKLQIDFDIPNIEHQQTYDIHSLSERQVVDALIDQNRYLVVLTDDEHLQQINLDTGELLQELSPVLPGASHIHVDTQNTLYIAASDGSYERLDGYDLSVLESAESGAQCLVDVI